MKASYIANKIHVQVININNLKYTKDLFYDLLKQSIEHKLTLIDQASEEPGTKLFFEEVEQYSHVNIIMNNENININKLWNNFYKKSNCPYMCFLNNDIRIPNNFLKDTVEIFERQPDVGCVVHPTNHPNYKKSNHLEYIVSNEKFIQGWDFTIRKDIYNLIPEDLYMFGGDDYLFNKMYDVGFKTAVALSSPIIHFHAKSRQYFNGDRNDVLSKIKKYQLRKLPYYNKKYSRRKYAGSISH
jgi:GT2 family glycosyltransferase